MDHQHTIACLEEAGSRLVCKQSGKEVEVPKRGRGLLKIRIDGLPGGPLLHLFSPDKREEIVRQAEQALARGASVKWEDGSTEWWSWKIRTDTTKGGSAQYTWDRKGDKVLADRVKTVRDKSGKLTEKVTGKRYVSFSD